MAISASVIEPCLSRRLAFFDSLMSDILVGAQPGRSLKQAAKVILAQLRDRR